MQRTPGTLFYSKPERLLANIEDIELADASDFAPEAPGIALEEPVDYPEHYECHALAFARLPFMALSDEIIDYMEDHNIIEHPRTAGDYFHNASEYTSTVMAAGIAYTSAALMSMLGFFAGAAHDIYYAASRHHHHDNIQPPSKRRSLPE